jgi:hypothetical protein
MTGIVPRLFAAIGLCDNQVPELKPTIMSSP